MGPSLMTSSFVHLHNHTEFSLLDGASKLAPLVKAAAMDGQPAMACTDHGNLYGLLDFYKECNKGGVKPILGMEAYMARHSIDDRPQAKGKAADDGGGSTDEGEKLYYHLTVMAENNTGYQNLIKLSSDSYLKGFWRKPRVDWDMLGDYADGLIVTSGCLGGVVLQDLIHDRYEDAKKSAARLQDIFGKDSFFIELMDHGIALQHKTNPDLMRIASDIGAPLVVTNDAHYVSSDDHVAHDSLLCIQTGAKISDTDRFRFEGHDHYLKSAAEMRNLFAEIPDACDNTLLIAERCDVDIQFGNMHVPTFDVPEEFADEEDYLRYLVAEGAVRRWTVDDEVAARLDYELEIICEMGFAGYFLIVWDLVRHAKQVGIRVGPARGSAGGCAVAYSLGITELDPLKYGLLFERFLNPSRVSMPDIDIDFDSRYRDHMINYTTERYGSDRVAQIITFTQIRSRNAVRDAARVGGFPYSIGDKIAKALPPPVFGRDTPLRDCLHLNPANPEGYERAEKFRGLHDGSADAQEIVSVALGLEGLRRQDGIHAAAVVIAPDEITKFVPIQWKPKSKKVTTQYEMHGIEDLGLLKMDYLGLKTLDILTDTLNLMSRRAGVELELETLPRDDVPTYKLLCAGETLGVFQVEGSEMRRLLQALQPDTFDDIAALVALYRPGPMAANMHYDYADRKNGRKPIEVFHDDAKDLLADTYGLMIYQEELMAVAQRFAGYSLGDGYNLVKICGKKLPEQMQKERDKFEGGMIANGYNEDFSSEVFDMVAAFADYAFNKSHSYGYGLLTYWTAYLKANYPLEFMTALLQANHGEHEKLAVYLGEAKRMGLKVLSPDINLSEREFAPLDEEAIVFGFGALRNIGEGPAKSIVDEREANGPYKSFFDYTKRVPRRAINKKVIDSLVGGGAFDSLGHPRRGLASIAQEVIKVQDKEKKEQEKGAIPLFEMEPSVVDRGVPNVHYPPEELLAMEKEYLGVFVSGHPLDEMQNQITDRIDLTLAEVRELDETQWRKITVAGIITELKDIITRKGDPMKTFVLEDISGTMPCVLFPKQTQLWGGQVNPDDIVILTANILDDRVGPKLAVETVEPLQAAFSRSPNVHVWLPDTYPVDDLYAAVKASHGDGPVVVHWMGTVKIADGTSSVDSLIGALDT